MTSAVLYIGPAVRMRRKWMRMTQRQLATLAGTQRPLVSRVELGRHVVSLETLERYAKALDLRASELLRAAEELAAVAVKGAPRRGQVWI